MKSQKFSFSVVVLILAMLACNMPGQASGGEPSASTTEEPTTVVFVVVEPTLTTIPPTDTPIPASATPALPPEITLLKNSNCRMGPSEFYFYIDQITKDTVLPVVGRSTDGSWWQVINATDRECWIYSENTQTNQDFSALPVVDGPILPNTPGNFFVVDQDCDPSSKKFKVAFSWVSGGGEDGFYLNRNGDRIFEGNSSKFNYKDNNAPLKQNLSYELYAFNKYGVSFPAVQIVPECK